MDFKTRRKFEKQKRKIIMFVDNCPAHPRSVQSKLKAIRLEFLPPNKTSVLQPMDQGIIHNVKCHYRRRILSQSLENSDKGIIQPINLLDAIRNLS